MGGEFDDKWTTDELVGGHPALDFVNTVGGRTKRRDVEWLVDYDALQRWSIVSGVLHTDEIQTPRSTRVDQEKELNQVHSFREALHACLVAELSGNGWPDDDANQVRREIAHGLAGSTLVKDDGRFVWLGELDTFGVALPRARLALATEAFLRTENLQRLRNCDRCSWLFLDQGRGRPRRWCSMATCGSRAKSARYYRRQKGE